MNNIYWWIITIYYKIFYKKEIFDVVLANKIFERGDVLSLAGMKDLMICISNPSLENQFYKYKVLPSRYAVSKRELVEVIGIGLFLICLLLFLILVFKL